LPFAIIRVENPDFVQSFAGMVQGLTFVDNSKNSLAYSNHYFTKLNVPKYFISILAKLV
jgi:hypothetical protein